MPGPTVLGFCVLVRAYIDMVCLTGHGPLQFGGFVQITEFKFGKMLNGSLDVISKADLIGELWYVVLGWMRLFTRCYG
jgi:hypothetical protein